MRIALTGSSGFIGSVIARALHARGHQVTGLVRSTSRRDHVAPFVDRFIEGDHADPHCWPALLREADAVVHNSFDWDALKSGDANRHLERNLLASIRFLHASAPRPFVFISSIAVHHDMRPRWSGMVDEDHPLRPASLYGACKAAIEDHLWAAHFEQGRFVSALRPCAVYGIDPRIERSIGYPIIRQIRDRRPFTRPGGGKFVHVDDVAVAVASAVGNPDASGRVYNLADCYAWWADIAQMIADHLGIAAEIDFSSPPQPKNQFTKDAARSLGVPLDRGHQGIRAYLGELVKVAMSGA